jgi:hypothetical protein
MDVFEAGSCHEVVLDAGNPTNRPVHLVGVDALGSLVDPEWLAGGAGTTELIFGRGCMASPK